MAEIFEIIINNPECVGLAPTLFKYCVTLIDKGNGKYRPICVEETLLNLMHKCISY